MGKKAPPIGRQSERGIRTMLSAIRKRMADPNTTSRELLHLLRHESRLAAELKVVAAEKIRTRLAALDSSTSHSEVLG